jgi:4-hydroxy-3-methylbut-2-enyl diphosphate reductase IspH
VHNERVVEEMENLGVRTVEEIAAVEEPTVSSRRTACRRHF